MSAPCRIATRWATRTSARRTSRPGSCGSRRSCSASRSRRTLHAATAELAERKKTLRVLRALRATFWLAAGVVLAAQTPSLGRISFPNSGSRAAQPAFVRGVLLLHSFEYDDAIQAFREAQRIDPGFALAYWGEAMAYDQPLWYNEDVGKARGVLRRLGGTPGARLPKAPPPGAQGYLDAAERLYGDGPKPDTDRPCTERKPSLST